MPTLYAPRALIPVALVAVALRAAPLAAQEAPDSAARAADTSRAYRGGASRVVLDSAALAGAPMRTFSEMLAARVPGLSVMRSSGTAGTGSLVRLRTAGGALTTDEPLLVIDGVRAEADQASLGVSVGGQQPSRLDDVAPEDVERVEILKGPAAAWRYGAGAANGVIVVTTKRGRPGPTRWCFATAGGAGSDPVDYPANYHTPGERVSTGSAVNCPLPDATLGTCVSRGATQSWNPLERASPLRTARQGQLAVGVRGGRGVVSYYASAGLEDERGALDGNDVRRATARANVRVRPRDGVLVTLAGGYLDGRTRLPPGEGMGVLARGLLGESSDDPIYRGFDSTVRSLPPPMRQDVGRLTASLTADWRARRWLDATATVGLDNVNRVDDRHRRLSNFGLGGIGLLVDETGDEHNRRVTARSQVTASYRLLGAAATTSAGVELDRTKLLENQFQRVETDDGSSVVVRQRRFYPEASATGLYMHQRLAWTERRVVGVGVRSDRLRISDPLDRATYTSADASWALGDEPFFPRIPGLAGLRLRAAYGEAGDVRSLLAVARHLAPFLPDPPSPDPRPGIVPQTAERELGADVTLLGRRLELEVTHFRKTTRDGIVLFPTFGVSNLVALRAGEWRNQGAEALLTAHIVDRAALRWDASLGWATNRSELRTLGSSMLFVFVTMDGTADLVVRPGQPLGTFWTIAYDYTDLNRDGVIVPAELTFATDPTGPPRRYGRTQVPAREVSLATRVRLFDRVTLSALLDHRGGHQRLNQMEAARCARGQCRDIHVPGAPLSAQARAVAARSAVVRSGYVEDADFTRLREVVATVQLPAAWGRALGARGATLTLAGRNLLTWTSYSGLDPEVSSAGQAGPGLFEYATQPLLRSVAARLDVSW